MSPEASSFAVVYVTFASRDQATRIARTLVEEKLLACANLLDPVTSIYRWEGKVNEDTEVLLIGKTRTALVEKIAQRVKELHSYTCPETIAVPLVGGAPWYLDWLDAETAKELL